MRASDQILEFLDAPKREDKYHRTEIDEKRLGDVSTAQLQHYLACRRQLEQHLDEESVFDELCRLSLQADDETCDVFDRITGGSTSTTLGQIGMAEKLVVEATGTGVGLDRLTAIALGMLSDGWPEDQIRFALGTLGAA